MKRNAITITHERHDMERTMATLPLELLKALIGTLIPLTLTEFKLDLSNRVRHFNADSLDHLEEMIVQHFAKQRVCDAVQAYEEAKDDSQVRSAESQDEMRNTM